MQTAYDLLMSAPDAQIKRCQIAYKAIAGGRFSDAALALSNAASEENGQWAAEAKELARHCENRLIKNDSY